jgi:multidrug efflux pump subunit AcrA (membrane-fusion protein)
MTDSIHKFKVLPQEREMALLQWFPLGRLRPKVMVVLAACLAVSLTACDRTKEADKAKPAAAAPPAAVVVADVVQKTVPIYSEFVAQTDARETVEIRARVQAFLEAQHFTEGTIVKKNQLLFTLDKREFEAKLQQAKAQLAIAMARLGKAETDERRTTTTPRPTCWPPRRTCRPRAPTSTRRNWT